MSRIENAKIDSTTLGVEDHGILTCMLMLSGDGWGIGFGGYAMDEPEKDEAGKFVGRRGTAFGAEYIRLLLETLQVKRWEDLPGTIVRVETEGGCGGRALRIGHALKDRWFDPKALAATYEPEAAARAEPQP